MCPKNRVAVVVDGSASLPAPGHAPLPSHVVPMRIHAGGAEYGAGHAVSPSEFYRLQREAGEPPTTAAPSPAAFAQAFRAAAEEAEAVLALTVSRRFSSTYDSARMAAEELRGERPGVRVEVVDTESAAGGQGLVATAACRAVEAGRDLDGVIASARAVIPRVYLVAYLDTLYYAWKSGRTPGIAYAGGALLGLKPVFEMHRGETESVARPRSAARARRRLIDRVAARAGGDPVHAAVIHADAHDAAEGLRRALRDEVECAELYVSELSPVVGAHTGPGLVGVAYWIDAQRQTMPPAETFAQPRET